MEYQAWQQIGISFGAFYSNQGYSYGEVEGLGKVTQSLHFINIPVLVNFYIEPNILPGLAIKAGVELGYLVSGKFKDNHNTLTNTSDFKRVNISIPAGISYNYRHIVLDLRYNSAIRNWRCKILGKPIPCGSRLDISLNCNYRFLINVRPSRRGRMCQGTVPRHNVSVRGEIIFSYLYQKCRSEYPCGKGR